MQLSVCDGFGRDAAPTRISESDSGRGKESAAPHSRLILDDVSLVTGGDTDVYDRLLRPVNAHHDGVPAGRPG